MTPALKAMVEAMAAEFERQGQDEPFEWIDASETPGRLSVLTYGNYIFDSPIIPG